MSASASSEFVRAMGPVARDLLGDPTEENKTKRVMRWGTRGSLCVSLDKGTWFDNESGAGGGVLDLVQDRKHLDRDAAIAWLQDRGHIPKEASGKRQVAWYDYQTASGELLFQVVRFEPKDFRQRRPDGSGDWIWKMGGLQLVPYRLPEVVRAIGERRTVYIAEGEKGVQALESIGLTGTCSPGGAGKWKSHYNSTFVGADVVVLPDNDPQKVDRDGKPMWHPDGRPVLPGQDHAVDVARNLSGTASKVRVVMLPGLPLKGDVADWIAAGGSAETMVDLAAGVPVFDAAANPKPKSAPTPTTGLDGFDLTEDGIALAFTKEHQDHLRLRPLDRQMVSMDWQGVAAGRDQVGLLMGASDVSTTRERGQGRGRGTSHHCQGGNRGCRGTVRTVRSSPGRDIGNLGSRRLSAGHTRRHTRPANRRDPSPDAGRPHHQIDGGCTIDTA